MKASELDWHGKLFGFKITNRLGEGALVRVFVEDDENYHEVMSFDIYWLEDLQTMCAALRVLK